MSMNKMSEIFSVPINMKSFTHTERYDIINSKKLLQSDIIDEEEKGSLKKYLKHGKGGKVDIEYTVKEIGRLGIRVKGLKDKETCKCQSFQKGVIKSGLCNKYYDDLDIENCHPVIALQVFNSLEFNTKYLSKYVNTREELFKQGFKDCGMSRDQVKTLAIRILYGGSLKAVCNEFNYDYESISSTFVYLESEMKENTEKILNKNEMLKYRIYAIEQKGEDYHNLNGTALSYYLQTLECKCLMTMVDFFNARDIEMGALIHDGLHIKKQENYDIIINNLQKELKDKTSFDLTLKIKPFKNVKELNDMIVVSTDKEGGAYITDYLKNDYIISNERIFLRVNNVWTENDKVIKRNLVKFIGNMNIYMQRGEEIYPYSTMRKGCFDMLPYVEPTEDEDFISNLWTSNLYKLCFKNGYYDFKKSKLIPYDKDTHTTIKINRDYCEADPETVEQVYERILKPIFNNDTELMNCWLNFIARGLAGHIEDKNWGVGIGERDCGKGVLVGLLENCFGEYCRSTNSENFLFKGGNSDSAKGLSWLVPYEFKRLLLTNEITMDSRGLCKINGNILKKLSSGGDKIEARVNFKDEINFKIQARVCMFCNDLPPIEPADTKETSYMFRYPSKFVNSDDSRLGNGIMRPVITEVDGETVYEKDSEGNNVMVNICNFYKKDDSIKTWCQSEKVLNAFIHILFSSYSDKVKIPENMKQEMEDFKDEVREDELFLSMFNFRGDSTFSEDEPDFVTIEAINSAVKRSKLALSPQKYKSYLLGKGCHKGKRKVYGKQTNVWIGIQLDVLRIKSIVNMNNINEDC